MKRSQQIIIGAVLIIALVLGGAAAYFGFSQMAIGSFSSLTTCNQQLATYMASGSYTCTVCDTKYSTGGWYSAWCFYGLGGQCLKSGGTCSDSYCTTCTGQTRVCNEAAAPLGGGIFMLTNYQNTCDVTVYHLTCAAGSVITGKEYASDRNALGACTTPATPPSGNCQFLTTCGEQSTCGTTRNTDGQDCFINGQPALCQNGLCTDQCKTLGASSCDGTTLKTSPTFNPLTKTCLYTSVTPNSAACGYVPPNPCETVNATRCDGFSLQSKPNAVGNNCVYAQIDYNSTECGWTANMPANPCPPALGGQFVNGAWLCNAPQGLQPNLANTTGGTVLAQPTSPVSLWFQNYGYYLGGGLIVVLLTIFLTMDTKKRRKAK